MPELTLTQEDINELLVVLNVALYDAQALQRQSHDAEEVQAYKDHQASVRKWIHRLSQQVGSEKVSN